jgi:hypothetical protein
MKTNADLNFVIAEEDTERLKNLRKIEHYAEHSKFPYVWQEIIASTIHLTNNPEGGIRWQNMKK